MRRGNVERYLAAERLEAAQEGIERLEGTKTIELPFVAPPDPEPIPKLPDPGLDGLWGLWLHDEDLSLERSPLAG